MQLFRGYHLSTCCLQCVSISFSLLCSNKTSTSTVSHSLGLTLSPCPSVMSPVLTKYPVCSVSLFHLVELSDLTWLSLHIYFLSASDSVSMCRCMIEVLWLQIVVAEGTFFCCPEKQWTQHGQANTRLGGNDQGEKLVMPLCLVSGNSLTRSVEDCFVSCCLFVFTPT